MGSRSAALFNIPQHLLLHEGQAWTDRHYGRAFQQLKEEVGDALDRRWTLCLLLLIERARGVHSKWATYINVLPESYEDPMWWSEENLDILKGTRLEAAVEHYVKGLEDLRVWRARLCTIQRELGGVNVLEEEAGQWAMSETALKWAKSTVWSRSFNIKSLGAAQKESIALIPVLDMLDHNPHQHVAWHTGSTGQDNFQFFTKSAIKKGDQLYSNYGHKSNEELLLGYGFVLEPNTADYFSVSLGLEACSAAGRERAAMLRALLHRLGLQTEFYLTRAFPLPSTLVVAAAACLLPSASAYNLLAMTASPSSDPTGDSNDRDHPGSVHLQALLALKQQLRGKMGKLQGGSYPEDTELAATAPAGSPRRMALVYRAGQKEIAHAALAELAQQTTSLLDTSFSVGSNFEATPGTTLLSGDEGSLYAIEALAGTQLGDILQGEAEQYQEQYAAAAPSLRAALESTSNGPQEHGSDQSEAGGHTAAGLYDELCPGLSNVEAVQALAWADAVVDRCGVPGASGSQMAILPLICATPTEPPCCQWSWRHSLADSDYEPGALAGCDSCVLR
ncbi:hypothetical protein WJX75_008596 [Coccomyxa subellipsoidea]|uniref:SET domain-containing protein n=1 Tax=Coccomyxa subellipsoidea TaxID=248742 RepID=A0ABR2YZ38_9CHLO